MSESPNDDSSSELLSKKHIGIFGVASLGIGSMVGAGVFALLGQVALDVRGETWLVFLVSGISALFSGYSYARLSAHYPSRGGVTDFFRVGFSQPRVERSLAILYMVTIVITLALIAKAFGAYCAHVFHQSIDSNWVNLYASVILLVLTVVNLMGSKVVGRVELVLVTVKLLILFVFIFVGAATLKPDMLSMHDEIHFSSFFSAMGLAFFAYSGYGLMASAAADVEDPERDMPRAFMLAIGFVMFLYIVLSFVVLGNVTAEALVEYSDTAVAQAAEPILGTFGFVMVSIAALVATASSITANIFSIVNVTKEMGAIGTLPNIFCRRVGMGGGTQGLYVLLVVILFLTNFLNLSAIADVASATFLMCYLAVFISSWRVRHEIHAKSWILACGFILMMLIFIMFLGSMVTSQKWVELGILCLAVLASVAMGWKLHPIDAVEKIK